MKKHEMVLDFTSLLDVILIILFLVLCSMNGKAQKDAEKIDDLTANVESLKDENEQLTGTVKDLEKLQQELTETLEEIKKASLEKGQELDEMRVKYDELKLQYERISKNLDSIAALANLDINDAVKYEAFKGNAIAVELELVDVQGNLDKKTSCRVNLFVERLFKESFLIEDTGVAFSYEYQSLLTDCIQKSLNDLKNSEEIPIVIISIKYDLEKVAYNAVDIVEKAAIDASKKCNSKDFIVLVYDEIYKKEVDTKE